MHLSCVLCIDAVLDVDVSNFSCLVIYEPSVNSCNRLVNRLSVESICDNRYDEVVHPSFNFENFRLNDLVPSTYDGSQLLVFFYDRKLYVIYSETSCMYVELNTVFCLPSYFPRLPS